MPCAAYNLLQYRRAMTEHVVRQSRQHVVRQSCQQQHGSNRSAVIHAMQPPQSNTKPKHVDHKYWLAQWQVSGGNHWAVKSIALDDLASMVWIRSAQQIHNYEPGPNHCHQPGAATVPSAKAAPEVSTLHVPSAGVLVARTPVTGLKKSEAVVVCGHKLCSDGW